MDLTSYGASPYGEQGPKRNDQQNWLSAVLRGTLGQEEPGSVLEPQTQNLKSLNSKAQLASILSDLAPVKAAAGVLPTIGGMFIGRKSKVWNEVAAKEAARLLKQGIDPKEIQRLTGTHVDFADKHFRQEIPDKDAILLRSLVPNAKPDELGKILRHDKLAEAYPELSKQIQMQLRSGPGLEGTQQGNNITVDANNLSNAMSGTLHEVQHAVDAHEGFSRGSSPSEFFKTAQWAAKARGKDQKWAEAKAYADYLRTSGEAAARQTQLRRMLDAQEQRNTPLNWDVLPERQQVLY